MLRDAISSLPSSVKLVAITGGEPFEDPTRLRWLIELISQQGCLATVVTNGHWLVDSENVADDLGALAKNGLHALSLSLDDYHMPVVPMAKMEKLLRMAREFGILVNLRGVGKKSQRKIEELERRGVFEGQESVNNTEIWNLELVGQAADAGSDSIESEDFDSCLAAMGPMLTPDGMLLACCSPRLFDMDNELLRRGLASEQSVGSILDMASRDYLLAALAVMGPRGLANIGSLDLSVNNKSRCQLCMEILNSPARLHHLDKRIQSDRQLRKEIVGRHLVFEHHFRRPYIAERKLSDEQNEF
jgi:hypothetical protein